MNTHSFIICGSNLNTVFLIAKNGYESTLSELVKMTYDNVRDHVAKEASVVSAIAQTANPGVKIDGSIE